MKIGTTTKLLAVILLLATSTAAAAFLAAAPPFGANQVLGRLPPGSSVHSLLRADLDGRTPPEVAAVARVPALPGANEIIYSALVFRYDRLRRTFRELYRAAAPGSVPFSVDAVLLQDGREAVVFSGLHDDGTRVAEVVAVQRGRTRRLPDDQAAQAVAALPVALPGVTWRYAVRNGEVAARTSAVRLRARQTLRIQAVGGGATSIVLPDARLDIVETGYRARLPGAYRIRIVTGLRPAEEAYTLTVIVRQ